MDFELERFKLFPAIKVPSLHGAKFKSGCTLTA